MKALEILLLLLIIITMAAIIYMGLDDYSENLQLDQMQRLRFLNSGIF